MRVIKHGECLKFHCPDCGCVWLASKDECLKSNAYDLIFPITWACACPDCGRHTTTREEAREGV